MATVERIFEAFTNALHPAVRKDVSRRYEAMQRELSFIEARGEPQLKFLRLHEWTDDRFLTIFLLNSVYQHLLGPLQSSARTNAAGIGTEYAIKHGSNIYGRNHIRSVNKATEDFFELIEEIGLQRSWMSKNTCGDLIYWISEFQKEKNNERNNEQ